MTFPEPEWRSLRWLKRKFGYRSIGSALDDIRDRCDGCGCVRFELRDGEPQCARCGRSQAKEAQAAVPTLEDHA